MLGEKVERHMMQYWSWEIPVQILVSNGAQSGFDQFSKPKFKNGPGGSCLCVMYVY